jgi:ElaB/YqjD/DUF883 family membrane-anchored ribosome-binding protein
MTNERRQTRRRSILGKVTLLKIPGAPAKVNCLIGSGMEGFGERAWHGPVPDHLRLGHRTERTAMSFMDTLKGWFGKAKEQGSELAEKAQPYVEKTKDFASDAGAKVKETSQDLYGTAKEKISDLTDKGEEAADATQDAASEAVDSAQAAAGEAAEAVQESAENTDDDVRDQFSS